MKMAACKGQREFGGVKVRWTCSGREEGCQVEISWQGDVVFLATLDPYRRSLSFEVDLLEPPGQKVEGKLTFRPQPERLMLEGLSYPGGSVASVQLCPLEGPEPP